jgi:hypothetical protein
MQNLAKVSVEKTDLMYSESALIICFYYFDGRELTDYSDMSSSQDSITELLIIASYSLESDIKYRPQEIIVLDSSSIDNSHSIRHIWFCSILRDLSRCSLCRI